MAAIAVIPALIGLRVNSSGPLAIAPVLFLLAVVMVISVEGLRVVARVETPAGAV
jgi:hypothetical protein